MAVQKCEWEPTKTVNINADLADRWFGMAITDVDAKCGRFTKGKRKGEIRGWIVYRKVRVGGWCYPLHAVLRPGMIFARFCETYDDACGAANLPTDQFISGSRRVDTCYGYEWRKAEAKRAEELRADADRAAQLDARRNQCGCSSEQADLFVGICLSAMASGGRIIDAATFFNMVG